MRSRNKNFSQIHVESEQTGNPPLWINCRPPLCCLKTKQHPPPYQDGNAVQNVACRQIGPRLYRAATSRTLAPARQRGWGNQGGRCVMARRELLSPKERQARLGIPEDEASLLRHCTLPLQDRLGRGLTAVPQSVRICGSALAHGLSRPASLGARLSQSSSVRKANPEHRT